MIKTKMLSTLDLIKFLLNLDEDINDLILLKPLPLITTDQNIYEAILILKPHELNKSRLNKLLENVNIISYENAFAKPRKIMNYDKLNHYRSIIYKIKKNKKSANP